ncbi:MAG: bifunctional aldolase/short-chain dehydrogenase [Gammaproteobacteria bacterium]|nr:bifunctional aldolase/short-chain dehydrogenase [Gammaproteobacteria bacterium]
MQNQWDDESVVAFEGPLGPRVYSSRLLGAESELVLHGGGNTSVKVTEPDLYGEPREVLYVKGSGWDLARIEAAGFAPLDLAGTARLATLERLSDLHMMAELKRLCLRAEAPTPSVEAILHAVLPHRYVDHTHADAVVSITNTPGGEGHIREVYGDEVVVIPYVMPGFDLARRCAAEFARRAGPATRGMVLMNHGIFSFGASARDSYDTMIELVSRAEAFLKARGAWAGPPAEPAGLASPPFLALARLRRDVADAMGRPCVLRRDAGPAVAAFLARPDVERITQRGPATPDHVIRTKAVPLWGRDVAAYGKAYRAYFERHAGAARTPVTLLDPAPRVVLDPELGLVAVGRDAGEADAVADIYRHTMGVIGRAEALGGYRALPEKDLFDMEYWELEQAKLARGAGGPAFRGEVVLVTGAASGIGRACVEAFRARGAAVVAVDVAPAVEALDDGVGVLAVRCDVSDEAAVAAALALAERTFGGLDMLVLNAGLFPGGTPVAAETAQQWRRVMAVNLDANLFLLKHAHGLLRLAPRHGRVVVMGSRNVAAPGLGAAAYSASKAALLQLARVTALEWAPDGIRVNMLHPDAVFDTGLWTAEVLAARAAHYGLSVEAYRRRNLLKTDITSRRVAELAANLCGEDYACTTGAQLPVDGGNERVI